MEGREPTFHQSWEEVVKNKCLNLNARILYYYGFLPSKREDSYTSLRSALAIITIVTSFAHVLVLDLINLILFYDDPIVLSESGVMMALYTMGVFLTLTFYWRMDNTRGLLEGIDKLQTADQLLNVELKSILDKSEYIIKKITHMYLLSVSAYAILLSVLAVESHSSRRLAFRFVDDLFDFVKIPIFSGLMAYSIILTVSLLHVSGNPPVNTITIMLITFILISGFLSFLFCFTIDCLKIEAAGIGEAAYFSDWFDNSEEFKRSMLLVLTRAQVPLTLGLAGKSVSVETFGDFTNTAYSWFKMMLGVTKK